MVKMLEATIVLLEAVFLEVVLEAVIIGKDF